MVGIFVGHDNSHAARLPLAAERIRECGASGRETDARNRRKTGIQVGRGHVSGEGAHRTRKLVARERPIALPPPKPRQSKKNPAIVNSIPAANDRSAPAKRVVGKSDARPEIFLVRM